MESGFLTLFAARKVKTGRCSVLHLPGKLALSQKICILSEASCSHWQNRSQHGNGLLGDRSSSNSICQESTGKVVICSRTIKTSELCNYHDIRNNTIYHPPIAASLRQTNLQSFTGRSVFYHFGFNHKESQITRFYISLFVLVISIFFLILWGLIYLFVSG